MLETCALDRINFLAYKIRCFGKVNFFCLKILILGESLSYYPIWVWEFDRVIFFWEGGVGECSKPAF